MTGEFALRAAVHRARALQLAPSNDVEADDQRRRSLEECLWGKWQAGESDPELLRSCVLN
jgi:hypothetical protein